MKQETTNTVLESYTVFSAEYYETICHNICSDDLISYFNDMLKDINDSWDNDEENKVSYVTTVEEVFKQASSYELAVHEIHEDNNKEVLSLIEQALKFNTCWVGETVRKEHQSYCTFKIKPLYIGESDYLIQCSCSLMTPSGYSDNGRKAVSKFRINKFAFTNIDKLSKYVVSSTARKLRQFTCNNSVNDSFEYIEY